MGLDIFLLIFGTGGRDLLLNRLEVRRAWPYVEIAVRKTGSAQQLVQILDGK